MKTSQTESILVVEYQIGFSNFFMEELKSLSLGEPDPDFRILFPGVLLIRSHAANVLKSGFVKKITLISSTFESIEQIVPLPQDYGTFYVRIKDSSTCHSSQNEREIGDRLGGKGRVNFKNPDCIINAYHCGEKWYIGREIYRARSEDLQKRKAGMRPFFSPTSMDPRFARFCVNASDTPAGGSVLDPFCGTGGMLIEAGLLNYRVIGIDISQEMVVGSRLNLKFYGIHDYEVMRENFLEYSGELKVDSVVTDLPYGRSSSRAGIEPKTLFSQLPEKIGMVLKDNGTLILVTNTVEFLYEFEKLFNVLFILPLRIHKSLVRYYIKMKKINIA